MAISSKLEQCLNQQGVKYQVLTGDDLMPTNELTQASEVADEAVAINVLLGDSLGKVQTLIPKNCLLDLTELCEQLGRNLRTLDPLQLAKLASEQETETLAAVPSLYELPMIIDAKLIELDKVYLDAGQPDAYIALDKQAFRKLAGKADIGFFSVSLDDIKATRADQDRDAIDFAVNNFTTLRIKQRLDETFEMPPLPATAERIIKLRLDPDAGVGELAAIVEKDPSLAAQVVSWASSPYYAAPGTIKSVQDAVVRVLGFDLVINLALGLVLGKSMDVPDDAVHGQNRFWQQAVYTAAMTEALVHKMPAKNRPSMGLAYLSGLLHSYGYLVLAHVFPPYFSLINRYTEANHHISHFYIEQHLLGVSREQIGTLLMASWGIPEEVTTASRYWLFPEYEGDHHSYAKLLYLAVNLLKGEGLYAGTLQPVSEALLKELGLSADDAEAALGQILDNKEDLLGIARNLG